MKTAVITSWYFNPIHPGHIECLELCKDLWDELRVIVNNDEQVKAKTWSDKPFQDEQFRLKVVSSMKVVDEVFLATDKDWSVCQSIWDIHQKIIDKYWPETQIIFGKWGDRFSGNIPEVEVCKNLNIKIKDGLWAKPHNSSEYRKKV